jgi:HEAT repeat protein
MFLAWSGFVLYKFVGSQHTVAQRRSAPTKSASQTPVRHTYAALTDEDIERLHQAPIQDQAEELLERAIQHDSRALDVFEQNIDSESWRGNIKLTDRMKNLEGRSQYSSDLRVRYANADLNLSMEGWAKNDQSAELLIQRAQSDTQYRAAAVYYMGMLAGRDVAYSRIHPVLLDYAQHDPDARVRQWAVEGMRYLATDEALDELFDIFVSDPSMQVRDRAGCNISDCGNFKRVQRMRMVPKFLALAQDSSASPQMRNWSLLALHEITDENYPTAAAWQSWFDQHSAEKLQQFQDAEWWQVRGDE